MTTGGAGGAVTTTSLMMVVRSVRDPVPELEAPWAGIWMTITGGDVGAGSGRGVGVDVGSGEDEGSGDGVGETSGVGVGVANGTTIVPVGELDGLLTTATGVGSGEPTMPSATPTIEAATSAAAAGAHRIPPPSCDPAGHVDVSLSGCVNRPFAWRAKVTSRCGVRGMIPRCEMRAHDRQHTHRV